MRKGLVPRAQRDNAKEDDAENQIQTDRRNPSRFLTFEIISCKNPGSEQKGHDRTEDLPVHVEQLVREIVKEVSKRWIELLGFLTARATEWPAQRGAAVVTRLRVIRGARHE